MTHGRRGTMPVVLQFLAVLCGMHGFFGLFIPDKDISLCYGLECMNNGTLDNGTCSCLCTDGYQGLLCETEMKLSSWPDGPYSLLSTVFGCPEPDNHGWKPGYVNLTVSSDTKTRQWFPERFRLLGPYHLHTIQLNFCTRTHKTNLMANMSWPPGRYCILKAGEYCLQGFSESSLPLKDYSVWEDAIGGVVPDVSISDEEVTLKLCCRDDGENGTAIDLPVAFPFYLLKAYEDRIAQKQDQMNPFPCNQHASTITSQFTKCQDVTGMVIMEEYFSFVKTTNRTWLERDGSFTVEESDLYFNLTLCYYEPYARRECMYRDDRGTSYRGRINVTSGGKPCDTWNNITYDRYNRYDNGDILDLMYEGDYTENYCRLVYQRRRPFCVIVNKTYFCDIPICDSSNDLPNVIKGNIYRSAPVAHDTPIRHISDGIKDRPPFATTGAYIEPWIQVDLQEDYEIHSITAFKTYDWMPYIYRRIVAYVSKQQWDFLTFGAYTCNGPYNTHEVSGVRFQCRRPLIGSYVTVQECVNHDPFLNTEEQRRLEIAELVIRGKATGCGKSLGTKSGVIKDFQFSSSTNGKGYYPHHARLNRKTGWCATSTDSLAFLQVDLLTPMVVQGIVMQGWTDDRTARIPNNFTIEYGNQDENLTAYVTTTRENIVFYIDQTVAPSSSQTFLLPHQLLTRIIRIYFYQRSSPVCVKFDLIGCPKTVEFDMKCSKDSTRFGLQVLPGHMFTRNDFVHEYVTTLDLCRSGYLSNNEQYASYCFIRSSATCGYLYHNRYDRFVTHDWETGHDEGNEFGQVMCMKEITSEQSCGGLVTSGGDIVSPSYPFFYGENLNCTWTVTVEEGKFVRLFLVDVILAEKEELYDTSYYFDCEDTLTIYDRRRPGENVVTVITGYKFNVLEGPRYISSSSEIQINLVSCHRLQESVARGFRINVDSVDCGGCGQGQYSCSRQAVCTEQCGYISSPDFPNYYPVASSCNWRIQGEKGQYVAVTFDMIDVIAEGENQCEGDYVSLFDLDLSKARTSMGKFCKLHRPIGILKSSWHMMDVDFRSDHQKNGRGFHLKYNLTQIQFSSVARNSSAKCNDSWYEFDRGCYSFRSLSDGLTWFDAERKCRRAGAHLVSISHSEEMLFLHSTIITDGLFSEQEIYIGLQKMENDIYMWTDGKPLTFTEWYSGDDKTSRQPDGFEKESCTMMKIIGIRSTASWHDVACSFDNIKQYICEIEDRTSAPQEMQLVAAVNATHQTGYYFWCSNGEQISRLFVCDGTTDCSDGSDEGNCTKDACPIDMFRCNDGSCLDIAFYCDHKLHCPDGSDEDSCKFHECDDNDWKCDNGQCVSNMKRCDLIKDCVDESDEHNCEKCHESLFQCYDGRCLPPARVCDGFVDCGGQYGEDEGPQCTTNSQPSCSAWFALGARQNGKYNINMEGNSGSFPVICEFSMTKGMITTVIHHSMEDSTVAGNLGLFQKLHYSVPNQIITNVKSTASKCRQRVQIDCVYPRSVYKTYTWWFDINYRHRFFRSSQEDCACTLRDACNANNSSNTMINEYLQFICPPELEIKETESPTSVSYLDLCIEIQNDHSVCTKLYDKRDSFNFPIVKFPFMSSNIPSAPAYDVYISQLLRCSCEKPTKDRLLTPDTEWGTDSGFIEDIEILPMTRFYVRKLRKLQRLRHYIGPLICEEPAETTMTSLLCKSGVVVDISHRCLLNYDVYHYHTGCRDLTHLQECENFSCPSDHIKCPSSFCIPLRLVCDGHPDCADGLDERGCGNMTCPGRFRCHDTKICIPWQQVCDDIKHCPDGDDEYFCNTSCPDACLCNGSHSTCMDPQLDDIKHLPTYTRVLNIHNSLNKTIINHTFDRMENLGVLDLSDLGVYELEEDCFSGLYNLFHLDLSMNFLEEIPKHVFKSMRNLKALFLRGNNIFQIYSGSFDGLSVLPSLTISHMTIQTLTKDMFQGLTNLRVLNFSENSIMTVEDGAFRGLETLRTLDLRKNNIKEFTTAIFSDLGELTHLYNDKYVFCCFKPSTLPHDQCLPKSDEFSSCSDLMKNEALRISMWVLGFIALAGNAITLIYRCILDKQSSRRSNDLFVQNLAFSDFLMGVYMIMIASADVYYRGVYSLNDEVWRGSWLCQLAGFLSALSSETSVMFLCTITLERVLVIRFPFKDFRTLIQKSSQYICLAVWFLGILFAGIPLLPMSYFSGTFYSRSGVCLALPLTRNRPPGWEYSTAIFVFWNFVCFVFIAFGQAVIYHTVKASQRIRKGRTNNDMIIARKLSFIVLTDFVCWFPICVMGLMALKGHVIASEVYAWVAVFVLPVNSALNPIIYTLSSVNTTRQRQLKKEQMSSFVSRTVVTTDMDTCMSTKMFLGLKKPLNTVSLSAYLQSATSPSNILTIAHKTAAFLDVLHETCLTSGAINTDNIYVTLDHDDVKKVFTSCVPMTTQTDVDFSKDIFDFGHLVSKMLKVYTVSKTRHGQEVKDTTL